MSRLRAPIALLFAATSLAAGAAIAQTGYEPPLRANDLASDERYSARVHSDANPAQVRGKDIGARRLSANNVWTGLKAGKTDDKVNENYIVYGKPFYAMAAGTVVGCWRNAPDNPAKSKHPDFTNNKMPNGGNHLYVLQDDGNYVLYAHAIPGTIKTSLCPHNAVQLSSNKRDGGEPSLLLDTKVTNGARVTPGMELGLIGNSGDSSGPHLHVHVVKGGVGQPMPFRRGMTTPLSADDKASIDGPWTRLDGKEMPKQAVLLWAPHRQGNYTFNNVPAANYQRMVDHLADSGLMPGLITCANNGATYNTTWSPMTVKDWASFNAMSPAEAAAKHNQYTKLGYQRTSSYTCGPHSVAVWKKQ